MNTLSVREGNSGILYIRNGSDPERVISPNCSLEEAKSMMDDFIKRYDQEFCEDEDLTVGGIKWVDVCRCNIFWNYFWVVTRYKELIKTWFLGGIYFEHLQPGALRSFCNNFSNSKKSKLRYLVKRFLMGALLMRNRFILKYLKQDVLFISMTSDNFRVKEIVQSISEDRLVREIIFFNIKEIKKTFFNSKYILHFPNEIGMSVKRQLKNNDLVEPFENLHIYENAFIYSSGIIKNHIKVYNEFNFLFSGIKLPLLVGMDDCMYSFPYLIAAKKNKIRTIGIQHTRYCKGQIEYCSYGGEFDLWFDALLVWGPYWKTKFLENNHVIRPSNIFVCSNKHRYDYSKVELGEDRPIGVLVPYEFLADTRHVGAYIRVLLDFGCSVYFKPRSDEPILDQIAAYHLGEYESKVSILMDITPSSMAKIDIVVGTWSTLMYDLVPYNKEMWVLDTTVTMLDEMVQDGYAKKVKLSNCREELINFSNKAENEFKKKEDIKLFGSEKISDVIARIEFQNFY